MAQPRAQTAVQHEPFPRGEWREHARREICELGKGALDLAGVIKALEDIGYQGWIMIERDSREPDYVQSAKNMRAVMRKYGY